MVIELIVATLLERLRATSHREVAVITDAEARYRAEAGSEKLDDIYACLNDASARLSGRMSRFLIEDQTNYADNQRTIPESYTYTLDIAERRGANKAEPLAEACNTFVLEYALSKFYAIVSQGDLSNKHSLLALDAGAEIERLLFTKYPPIV